MSPTLSVNGGAAKPRERGIIMTGESVRGILARRKTQTRRVLTTLKGRGRISEFGPSDTKGFDWHFRDAGKRWHDVRHARILELLPHAIGDRLWVREAWQEFLLSEHPPGRALGPPGRFGIPTEMAKGNISHVVYRADGEWPDHPEMGAARWRSPIHTPRWASRLTLAVTDVRVQRLDWISEDDAQAEGVSQVVDSSEANGCWTYDGASNFVGCWDARGAYQHLWNSIHGPGAWDRNPWVAAITFEVSP